MLTLSFLEDLANVSLTRGLGAVSCTLCNHARCRATAKVIQEMKHLTGSRVEQKSCPRRMEESALVPGQVEAGYFSPSHAPEERWVVFPVPALCGWDEGLEHLFRSTGLHHSKSWGQENEGLKRPGEFSLNWNPSPIRDRVTHG